MSTTIVERSQQKNHGDDDGEYKVNLVSLVEDCVTASLAAQAFVHATMLSKTSHEEDGEKNNNKNEEAEVKNGEERPQKVFSLNENAQVHTKKQLAHKEGEASTDVVTEADLMVETIIVGYLDAKYNHPHQKGGKGGKEKKNTLPDLENDEDDDTNVVLKILGEENIRADVLHQRLENCVSLAAQAKTFVGLTMTTKNNNKVEGLRQAASPESDENPGFNNIVEFVEEMAQWWLGRQEEQKQEREGKGAEKLGKEKKEVGNLEASSKSSSLFFFPFQSELRKHGAASSDSANSTTKNDCYVLSGRSQTSRLQVLIDPIDGTRAFVEGVLDVPTTLVGISYDGQPIAGVSNRIFMEDIEDSLSYCLAAPSICFSFPVHQTNEQKTIRSNPPEDRREKSLLSDSSAVPLPCHSFVVLNNKLIAQVEASTTTTTSALTPQERKEKQEELRVTFSRTVKWELLQPFIEKLSPCQQYPASGAGYKFMMVVEQAAATQNEQANSTTKIGKIKNRKNGDDNEKIQKTTTSLMNAAHVFLSVVPGGIFLWDTCAPHAFLRCFGGDVVDCVNFQPVLYHLPTSRKDNVVDIKNDEKADVLLEEGVDPHSKRLELPFGLIACCNMKVTEEVVSKLKNNYNSHRL